MAPDHPDDAVNLPGVHAAAATRERTNSASHQEDRALEGPLRDDERLPNSAVPVVVSAGLLAGGQGLADTLGLLRAPGRGPYRQLEYTLPASSRSATGPEQLRAWRWPRGSSESRLARTGMRSADRARPFSGTAQWLEERLFSLRYVFYLRGRCQQPRPAQQVPGGRLKVVVVSRACPCPGYENYIPPGRDRRVPDHLAEPTLDRVSHNTITGPLSDGEPEPVSPLHIVGSSPQNQQIVGP